MLYFDIFICFVDATLAVWFLSTFCQIQLISWMSAGLLILHAGFNTAILFIPGFSPAATVVNILLLLAYSVFGSRSKWGRRILGPFIFEGTIIIVNTLIVTLVSSITRQEFSSVANDAGIIRLIMLVMSKLGIWLALLFIVRISKKDISLKYQDYFLLILFPIALFFELAILIKIALAYPMVELFGYFAVAVFSLFVTYVGIYYMVYKMIQKNRMQSENDLYLQMLHYEEKRYSDMEDVLDQIKKIRHDIQNQLFSVQVKLQQGETERAKDELDHITQSVASTGNIIKTNNKVVDYIINTKLSKATNTSIVVTGDVDGLTTINDLDLSILLGNVIDNAIEATQKQERAHIEVSFSRKDYYQNIICKNTIPHSVLKTNPQLISNKSDPSRHGYGLKSVKEITERVGGNLDISENADEFIVHIMLPISINI